MKKAVCIYGELRVFDVNYINEFYKDYDVFIHTYSSGDLAEIIEGLDNLKSILVEPLKNFGYPETEDSYFGLCKPNNIVSMFHSLFQTTELKRAYEKEFDFKYDLVVTSRSDLFFEEAIKEDIDLNVLNINDNFYSGMHAGLFVNDHFCISSSENIDKYSNVINVLEKNVVGRHFIAERILNNHLQSIGIPIKLGTYYYSILRPENDLRPNFTQFSKK